MASEAKKAKTSNSVQRKVALITGITGQDGSYLAEFLLKKGYEVHGIIRRSSSFNTSRIEHLYEDPKSHTEGSMHLHYGDLTDSTCLVKIISCVRPDEVYNLGAQSHVKVSFELAEYTANVDAVGTLRLLDAIRTCGLTDSVKFYQASTSEMFGKVQEIPQKETTPFYPRSPYGVAKLYAYWIVINYREAYDMYACNGILFNHESPRRGETFVTRKITRAVAKITLGQQESLQLGNLDAKRDWGHAKDYVEAMWLMLQTDIRPAEDFVISMGESHSVREFVEKAFKCVNVDIIWEGEGVNEVGKDKATGVVRVKVNPKYYRPTEVVRHSQRMNDSALQPWVIVTNSGTIESGHCNCMAGLGEVCSHVGALLFYIETAARINSSKTVTQEKAYWKLPSSVDKVPYSEVRSINFKTAESLKRKLDSEIDGQRQPKKSTIKLPQVPKPTKEDMASFRAKLHTTNRKAAILSVTQDYQQDFIPDILKEGQLPPILTTLRDEKYHEMNSSDLRTECKSIFNSMTVTEQQCTNAEILTRQQSKCKEWHSLRMGRITASNMKSACSTKLDKPAISTVQKICGQKRFISKATQWGCAHEKYALAEYRREMAKTHNNVNVRESGFCINPKYPHIGASPDGVISCDCCSEGLVEIKCPHCAKDQEISDENVSYLHDGKLKTGHQYYYQVQTQMLVTEKTYCDFVVWTLKGLSVERIYKNEMFQEEMLKKSTDFFLNVILPELTGSLISRERQQVLKDKCETNSTSDSNVNSSSSADEIICICQKPYDEENDNVVGCDNENCTYKWFHFECVKLKKVPKGKYYCPTCKPKFNKISKKQ